MQSIASSGVGIETVVTRPRRARTLVKALTHPRRRDTSLPSSLCGTQPSFSKLQVFDRRIKYRGLCSASSDDTGSSTGIPRQHSRCGFQKYLEFVCEASSSDLRIPSNYLPVMSSACCTTNYPRPNLLNMGRCTAYI